MKNIIIGLLLCSPLGLFAQNKKIADTLLHASPDVVERYIKANPDSLAGFVAILYQYSVFHDLMDQNLGQVNRLYALLSPRVRNTANGKTFGEKLAKYQHLIKGAVLPGFTATDTSDHVVNLADFRGKYVLVDLWASWCTPCRMEFPYLKKAYARFKDQNFEIVGYSMDNEKSLWTAAVKKDSTNWIQVSRLEGFKDPLAATYDITGIPRNWLLDPSGKVIAYNLRGEAVEEKLVELLK